MKEFTTFSVGDLFLGIDILLVREINKFTKYTEVPNSHESIKGLSNLRGEIITILDLAHRFSGIKTELTEDTKNIILKNDKETRILREQGKVKVNTGNDSVGFMIDQVGDVIQVKDEDISPTPANLEGISKSFIDGVVELKNKLLIILKVEKVIDINYEKNHNINKRQ